VSILNIFRLKVDIPDRYTIMLINLVKYSRMSKHLIEDVILTAPMAGFSNFVPDAQDSKPCHLVFIYEDQESRNRANRMSSVLQRLFSDEIESQESWWKLSILREQSMARLAMDDLTQADVVFFALGENSELSEELLDFNKAWSAQRKGKEGILAIQMAESSGDTAESVRNYFRDLAQKAGLDFLATEPDASAYETTRNLKKRTHHGLEWFHQEPLAA